MKSMRCALETLIFLSLKRNEARLQGMPRALLAQLGAVPGYGTWRKGMWSPASFESEFCKFLTFERFLGIEQ